ncbi:MAG: hypothetical protein R3E79_56155 [Caldilineaceae bacterium]
MKQQYKLHFLAFVVATLLAMGGLVAQSHSAYAGMTVPTGPRFISEGEPILPDSTDWLQLQKGNLPPTAHDL